MIISLKEQFKKPILVGSKIHTIRADHKLRWKAGRTAQLATGVRTKKYNCFKEVVIQGIEPIQISYTQPGGINPYPDVYIGGQYIPNHVILQLALNDGFESIEAFNRWFGPITQETDDGVFVGRILHWTKKRYIYDRLSK